MATKKKMLQAAAGAGGDVGAWDLSYAYYDDPNGWDLSSAIYRNKSFDVSGTGNQPFDLFFKPDGTKMYILAYDGDDVNEYNLSTAWDATTATYVQAFSIAAQDIYPFGVFFKPDGTKMYFVGDQSDSIHEYDLSTAWDISTSSFSQSTSLASRPSGLFFHPDGTKMYHSDLIVNVIWEYNLSTAWDTSTITTFQSFSIAAQDGTPYGLAFKTDGTKMYFVGGDGDDINEYDLSTAWDISTASFVQNFSVASQETNPYGIFIKPNGLEFYVVGSTTRKVYQYSLGGFSVDAQEGQPRGMCFDTDGSRMYVVGTLSDAIKEYSLSTNYDLSTASYVRGFYIGSTEQSPQGIFFKPDGTTVYACGSTTDSVHQWSLSTAWDVSTMSYVQSLGVGSQDATPAEVFFKPDGTVMYIAGQASVSVFAYTLSTAWDISTASYSTSFSLSGQIVSITGLFFKDDGTKMYTIGYSSLDINEYDLSTAWDISTASFVQEFNLPNGPMSAVFNNDGTKLFELGWSTDRIYTYSLGVQE